MKKLAKSFIVILIIVASAYFNEYINDSNKTSETISDNTEYSNVSNNFIKAYVSRVVDGDTIEVTIDSKKYKVRLIGVDCPEYTSKVEYYGKEATEYTSVMLSNKYVFLEKDISETDKYGRLLRYVWLEIPTLISIDEIKSKMFNALLLDDGYASTATYPPDVKYSKDFKSIAADARENNSGLWNK